MKPKLLKMWAEFAKRVALLSTCDRTQVGALVLSLDGERLLSYGYNGGPRGGPNLPPEGDHPGTEFWVHAEANALVKSRGDGKFLLLCTHTPCDRCASLIINSGAWAVICLEKYRRPQGWELLKQHYPSTAFSYCVDDAVFSHGIPRGIFLLDL